MGILQAIQVAIHDRGQLDEKAKDLVRHASIVAMGLHGAVEEHLKGDALDFERWSFFATAAAVDVGTTLLARSMSEKEFIGLLGYIYGDLHERFGDEVTRAIGSSANTGISCTRERENNGSRHSTGRACRARPGDAAVLDEAAATLKANPGVTVDVNGYTDAIGSVEYNQKLSERRAASVVRYLVKAGILEDRLVPKGFGKTDFVATNDTAEGRAQNRRVELIPVQ